MFQIRRASSTDRDAIVKLWQSEWQDEATFVDEFCRWCGWKQIFLLLEEGEPVAMTAAPWTEVVLHDGSTARAGYLYAHMTRVDRRGNGYGRMLINYTDFCLQNDGADGVILVPAEPGLFTYFQKSLYLTGFSVCEEVWLPEQLPQWNDTIFPLSAVQYGTTREQLCTVPHVRTPIGLLEQQKQLCRTSGGDLYGIKLPHGLGCAAVERWEDGTVLLRELIAPPQDTALALAAVDSIMHADRYAVRRLCDDREKNKPFGMYKWYRTRSIEIWKKETFAYFGLALD